MQDTGELSRTLDDYGIRISALRGYLDYQNKRERLEEVLLRFEEPNIWSDQSVAQELGRERARLEEVVGTIHDLTVKTDEAVELLDLANTEEDVATIASLRADIDSIGDVLSRLEFRRMFAGEADAASAFVDIQAGSGGTEAQDWAAMLLRMYLRWAEREGFKVEMIERSEGEVAGIKSATIQVSGEYAYGHLRTETGVHRLVRKSPFDSGNRRHTSFASVFAYPEVDDTVDIEVNPADLRVDTYRASGAGGQHVNKTNSAVRLTHLPSGIVVQCQNDRSQHRNRAEAMNMLRARLYEAEMRKRREDQQGLEDSKSDIGWGSQIRSYVLDQSRIKDLRTGVETGNPQGVLDGNLRAFIEARLKQGL
ncbi:MAG: peptide chain release factor 2 [Pseudomonadota bacterium]|nr:peptide chain release factor 2 [Pseudomonadota bacterium]